jgi:hypothetical protein
MNRKYRRLTITDRTLIGHLKVKGLNQTQIANLLGFNRSTICRELKRNHDPDFGYNILIAHEKTQDDNGFIIALKSSGIAHYSSISLSVVKLGYRTKQFINISIAKMASKTDCINTYVINVNSAIPK